MQHTIEQRRLRFASIAGIDRADIPLAAEVWQSDINQQLWIGLDTVKLASLFAKYMSDPNEKYLSLNYLERTFHMDTTAVRDALRQMKMYGVIEAFTINDGIVRVSLRLTLTQRLRVLEMRNCLLNLSGVASMRDLQAAEENEQWDLPAPDFELEPEQTGSAVADADEKAVA